MLPMMESKREWPTKKRNALTVDGIEETPNIEVDCALDGTRVVDDATIKYMSSDFSNTLPSSLVSIGLPHSAW